MRRSRYVWDEYFRYAWMIYYATFLLCAWAVMMLISDDPFGSTPVSALKFGSRFIAAPVLLVAVAMAIRGVRRRGTPTGWLLMVPQQLLLILAAIAGMIAIARGHYADFEPRPRLFIAADQMPGIVAALCHSLAIFDLHRTSRVRRLRSSVSLSKK